MTSVRVSLVIFEFTIKLAYAIPSHAEYDRIPHEDVTLLLDVDQSLLSPNSECSDLRVSTASRSDKQSSLPLNLRRVLGLTTKLSFHISSRQALKRSLRGPYCFLGMREFQYSEALVSLTKSSKHLGSLSSSH